MKIYTEIQINASSEKVWSILTDFDKYHEWNPFIASITGEVAEGNTIAVHIQNMHFKPKVLTYEVNHSFSWLGHLWIKGFFDGLHSFTLIAHGNAATTLIHQEKFSGILVPLLRKKLNTNTKEGFQKMNKALKLRAEAE